MIREWSKYYPTVVLKAKASWSPERRRKITKRLSLHLTAMLLRRGHHRLFLRLPASPLNPRLEGAWSLRLSSYCSWCGAGACLRVTDTLFRLNNRIKKPNIIICDIQNTSGWYVLIGRDNITLKYGNNIDSLYSMLPPNFKRAEHARDGVTLGVQELHTGWVPTGNTIKIST